MKLISKLLLLNLILQFVSAAESIIWDPVIMLQSCAYEDESSIVYPIYNGDVHIFRDCKTDNLRYVHQIRYSNKTLSKFKYLDEGRRCNLIKTAVLSVGGSKDGKNLIFTYHGTRSKNGVRCNYYDPTGCNDIFYTESINGGESWTNPILLPKLNMNDPVQRYFPSVIYEKDTGRVYIAYFTLDNASISISIREPNKSTFEYPLAIPFSVHKNLQKLKIVVTRDKQSSKRYLHIFYSKESSLYYIRSNDGGKTWNPTIELLKNVKFNKRLEIIANIEAAESTIYIQYFKSPDIRLIFSKDNGFTWESSFKSGSDNFGLNSLGICGNKEKAYVISMNANYKMGNKYIRCNVLYERFFRNLKYPFDRTPGAVQPNIQCAYNDKNKYTVAAILSDSGKGITYFAHSTIPLDKVEPGKGIPRKTYFTLVSLRKPTELPPLEAKPSNDDILNAILPPREWIENSCLLINFRYSLYTIRIT